MRNYLTRIDNKADAVSAVFFKTAQEELQ